MKKLLITLLTVSLLSLPFFAAALTVPWNRPTVGVENPLYPNDKIGIGTTTPWGWLSINNNTSDNGAPLFAVASSTATATTTVFMITNTGNVGVGTSSPDATLGVTGNFNIDTSGGKYSWLGVPMSPASGAALAQGSDTLVVGTTSSITSRVGAFTNNYTGGASASAVAQGINSGELLGTTATGGLSVTNAAGGGLRSRYIVGNLSKGYNVAQMTAVSGAVLAQGTLASTTDAAAFQAETPIINAGNLVTNFRGLWARGAAVSGTLTNQAGVDVENLIAGTNNTEILFGTATIPAGNFGMYQADTKQNSLAGFFGLGTTTPDAQFAQLAASSTVNFAGIHDVWGIIAGVTYLFERIDGFMHLITSGPPPVLSACGTSTISGNDRNGTITLAGLALTSCTMTFARTYSTAPDCVVSDNTTASTADLDTTATTVTFGLSVGLNSGKLFYQCVAHQ